MVTISTDGRIVEWTMKKGLVYTTLMVLKRVVHTEGIISRQACGLSFDFPQGDNSSYFAGTEDGVIHKCSVSYNEQYLETYTGHTGPVYKIECSPFEPTIFLSCSADWTIRLWSQMKSKPVFTFQSLGLSDAVTCVTWSGQFPTVFASVCGDGRVEIWDLAYSTLDPVVRKFIRTDQCKPEEQHVEKEDEDNNSEEIDDDSEDLQSVPSKEEENEKVQKSNDGRRNLCSVAFAKDSNILVVGDDRGVVDVFRISGIFNERRSMQDDCDILRSIVDEEQSQKVVKS